MKLTKRHIFNYSKTTMKPLLISKNNLSSLERQMLLAVNEALLLSKPQIIIKRYIGKLSENKILVNGKAIDVSKGKLYVLGWGKVSAAMAQVIESILGTEMITEGIVVSDNINYKLKKVKLLKGSHPLPSRESVNAAKQIINLTKKFNENDHVLCLISGGGSSLLCLPVPQISLEDKIKAINTMILSGLSVQELNIVRKRLSDVKGGKLANHIYPAATINLIISDDVDNNIYSIASGATVPDSTTCEDALSIIKKYKLFNKLPLPVMKYLQSNINDKNGIKPLEEPDIFGKTTTVIVFDNKSLLENIKITAQQKGFENIDICKKTFRDDVEDAVYGFCSYIREAKAKYKNSKFLILAGGEAEVKSAHTGKGGRAQHFAALMMPRLKKFKKSSFAAIASDGKDFIEGIAGALVNNNTMEAIKKKKIDYTPYIRDVDTFNLHKLLNTHIFTAKHSEINVFDVYLFCQEG